jgi:hypothetical protein
MHNIKGKISQEKRKQVNCKKCGLNWQTACNILQAVK